MYFPRKLGYGLFNFFDTIKDLNLKGLDFTGHISAHESFFFLHIGVKNYYGWFGFPTIIYKVVSSANNRLILCSFCILKTTTVRRLNFVGPRL